MSDNRWTAAEVQRYLADAGRSLAPGSMALAEEGPRAVRSRTSDQEEVPTRWGRDIPQTLSANTTEAELRALIRKVALPYGWKHYHPWNSEKSEPGWPDDCLARPRSSTSAGRLIFAELKSAKGKLTSEQAIWLDVLRHTIPHLEVYVWRPADITDIVAILTRSNAA